MNSNGHVFGWHFPPGVTALPEEGEDVRFHTEVPKVSDEETNYWEDTASHLQAVKDFLDSGYTREEALKAIDEIAAMPPSEEGEQEPNPYTLCPDCGATHHEDEAHQCKGVYIRGSEVVQDWDQDEQDEQDYADMCELLDEEVDDV